MMKTDRLQGIMFMDEALAGQTAGAGSLIANAARLSRRLKRLVGRSQTITGNRRVIEVMTQESDKLSAVELSKRLRNRT